MASHLPAVEDNDRQNQEHRRVDQRIDDIVAYKDRLIGNIDLRVNDGVLDVEVAEVGQQVVHQVADQLGVFQLAGGQRLGDAAEVADDKDAERHKEVQHGRGEGREEDGQGCQEQQLEEGHRDALDHFGRNAAFL